jgi:hypothetical protein
MAVARPTIKLAWKKFSFLATSVDGWVALKQLVDLEEEHSSLLSSNAVYVIRIMRPFAFSYPKRASAVAYIGEGNAKGRLTSHIKTWIAVLKKEIPDLRIEVCYCEPRIQKSGFICEAVEADLLYEFILLNGQLPLRNKQKEHKHRRSYIYTRATYGVLGLGQGKGFKYALKPMKSSGVYAASLK